MLLLLAALTLLAVAGPGLPLEEWHQVPEPVPPPAPLVLRLDMPELAPAGMPVPYRLTLVNQGATPVRVELERRPIAFDLLVRSADGTLVWRRLQGLPLETTPLSRTLGPREVLTLEGRWDQRDHEGWPAPAGVYSVRGVLPVAGVPGGWGSPARELTIIP